MSEKIPFISNLNQLDISNHLRKEIEEYKYLYNRDLDFWEWLEDEIGETKKDLMQRFEDWEDDMKK